MFEGMAEELIDTLSEEAKIDKPNQLSVFLYYRALGEDKVDIAERMGVDRKTLYNWETKLDENLNEELKSELVVNAIALEHSKRQKDEG